MHYEFIFRLHLKTIPYNTASGYLKLWIYRQLLIKHARKGSELGRRPSCFFITVCADLLACVVELIWYYVKNEIWKLIVSMMLPSVNNSKPRRHLNIDDSDGDLRYVDWERVMYYVRVRMSLTSKSLLHYLHLFSYNSNNHTTMRICPKKKK